MPRRKAAPAPSIVVEVSPRRFAVGLLKSVVNGVGFYALHPDRMVDVLVAVEAARGMPVPDHPTGRVIDPGVERQPELPQEATP